MRYVEGAAPDDVPDEKFDVIILSNVLEHIDDRPGTLRKLVDTARPTKLFIRVPTFDREWRVPLKKELGVDERLDDDHRIEYTRESFGRETAEAGLTIDHLEIRWSEIWSELSPVDVAPEALERQAAEVDAR